MTETPSNERNAALFARARQLIDARGVDIRTAQNGNGLRLEFADGQRILLNIDAQTQNVWLAARSGGIEFTLRGDSWRAPDQSELFAKLDEAIEQTIASNPLNARAPLKSAAQPARPEAAIYYEEKESHRLRTVLIVLLAGLIGFWAAQRFGRAPAPDSLDGQAQTLMLNRLNPRCDSGFPANGSVTTFPESTLRADGPNDTAITLKNDHPHPVLLILALPQSAIPALSVLVHARQNATLHLPPGQYDMMLSVGDAWCNPRNGFSEGHLLKFDKPLQVQADRPVELAMQSSGAGAEDLQMFVKVAHPEADLPPPTFSGNGGMEVRRHPNGHFYLPGNVADIPTTFMVDTGASVTSISSELARQAGIHNCKEMQFQTANGTATGCIALLPRLTLGNFVLENITVAVMPNIETNLLGANVLRNFQVSQNDSSMLLERR